MNNPANQVEVLTGNNYRRWRDDIELALTLLDLDMAITEPKPMLTYQSTEVEKAHY